MTARQLFNRYVDKPEGYTELHFTRTRYGSHNLADLFMRFYPNKIIKAEYTQQGHSYLNAVIPLLLDLKAEQDAEVLQ